MNLVTLSVTLLSLVLCALSLFSLYLMLYAWEHPTRLAASSGPQSFLPPRLSFTVLLPARHEEGVIHETIRRVWAANYPSDLLEVVVVCHADDEGTIAQAQRAVHETGSPHVRVETFANAPINKPHGLNVGFQRTANQVVTVFDAEDDIDADIFNVVNTVMLGEEVGIVQAGVQLMNFRDHWFSIHNCLEYFFWFKSRLHFHAAVGMIPLGGNTVFIRRPLIARVGGWDENCLTEDAEIGLRLSLLGEPIRVVYDPQYVTREETPDTLSSFIKQRTRWNQGFLQVLVKGAWRGLPRQTQRLLAVYTLSYPFFQALLLLLWPLTISAVVWLKVPLVVALVSFLPLYAFLFQMITTIIGAFIFARAYGYKVPILMPLTMAITFVPFQLLQSVSAVRAVYRALRGQANWEKTAHVGAHRLAETVAFGGQVISAGGLEALLHEVTAHLGVERASIMVLDPVAHTFSIQASQGLPDEVVRSTRVNADDGVAGWVAQTGRPAIINDRPAPHDLACRLAQPALRSAIVLPIEQRDAPLAILSLSSARTLLGDDALRWVDDRVRQVVEDRVLTAASVA